MQIERYFKGTPLENDRITIEDFSSPTNFNINRLPSTLSGEQVVLFIQKDSLLNPSFWGWELSALWIQPAGLMGVVQLENPGGWNLTKQFSNVEQLALHIDHWAFLEQTLEMADTIADEQLKLD